MGGRSQSGTCSSDEEYEVCTRTWSFIIWKAHSLSVVWQVENSYYKKQWKDSGCSSTSCWLYWQKWTMKSPAPWWLPAYSYGSDLCPCLNEHLEGWAVNQALRVVLLNNYLLPKDCDFSLDFFHWVISAYSLKVAPLTLAVWQLVWPQHSCIYGRSRNTVRPPRLSK